jgi:hypothetical protein
MPTRFTWLTRTKPVPYRVVGFLLILTFMSLVPASVTGARGGKPEVFPVPNAAPVAVFIEKTGRGMELRRQMRAKNGVSGLSPTNSVIRFSVAPTGTLGLLPQSSREWP